MPTWPQRGFAADAVVHDEGAASPSRAAELEQFGLVSSSITPWVDDIYLCGMFRVWR